MRLQASFVLCVLVFGAVANSATAAITTHVTEAAFNAAASALTVTTENFDSVTMNTEIVDGAAFNGITFTYGTGLAGTGESVFITDGTEQNATPQETTSGDFYLGTDTGDVGDFLGDTQALTLTFANPVSAVGLYLIIPADYGPDALFAGDIQINAAGTNVLVAENPIVLAGGSEAHFVGLVDDMNTFNSVEIQANGFGGTFEFGIDDVSTGITAVPEPGGLAFLGFAMGTILVRRRR